MLCARIGKRFDKKAVVRKHQITQIESHTVMLFESLHLYLPALKMGRFLQAALGERYFNHDPGKIKKK